MGDGTYGPVEILLVEDNPHERIEADSRTRSIPVVMLTSSKEETDLVRSYDLGVNSYLVKPVDFQRFSEEVTRVGHYWVAMNQMPGDV
jgi:two-component system response regulator